MSHRVRGATITAIALMALSPGLLRAQETAMAARERVRTLTLAGRYDEAVDVARAYERAHPRSAMVANALGEALFARGRLDEAAIAFRRAAAEAPDSLPARLNLAHLALRRGDAAEAMRAFDAFIDVYNRAQALGSEDLAAVAGAVRHLGARDPEAYRDALRAYDEAIAADSGNLDAQVALGELFLEKYAGSDAREAFQAVLRRSPRHPGALFGLARVRRFAAEPGALALTDSALATNPNLVAARVFRAMLLAESEEYGGAVAEVSRALDVDPTDLDALSLLGAIRYLQGDQGRWNAIRDSVRRLNPRFAGVFTTIADLAQRNRLYQDAARFAQQAVAVDSTWWIGYQILGVNQLRLGLMRQGRANLDIAFRGDPYDVWTKNTLDLLDALDRFDEFATPRFRFVAEAQEADVLRLYAGDLAEAAYDSLAAAYGVELAEPVRVEIYPRHADFSVRTVGLVGLGALGASFGPVVAMDSPSARAAGEFHWGSTLWHEISHSFHAALSRHRVPRWFTEGLAVYEERRARPGWGDGPTPAFLTAFREGRLYPVSRLNSGFLRPAYPEQLGFSYYQASLVCELIANERGRGALTEMLRAFGRGASVEAAFRDVVGTGLDAFDGRFDAWVRARFADPLTALRGAPSDPSHAAAHDLDSLERRARDPDDLVSQLALGRALVERGEARRAVPYLERAKALFPQYAGPGNAYALLADAFQDLRDARRAIGELRALTSLNAGDYGALLALADLLTAAGDRHGAADALDRALYVYPLDPDVHLRLASLATALGDWRRAVRERRAVLALGPTDRADALYLLARAYFGARDLSQARTAVMQALEIAPSFQAAQELLLQIHEAGREP